MTKSNPHFSELSRAYIFPIIEKKLAELSTHVSLREVLNFGIGDVAKPLAPSIVEAICQATKEMGTASGLKGYGPSEGYLFLREAIATNDYAALGIQSDEIFISDGINSDAVNFLDLFSLDTVIGIPNPTYPAYLDASILAGRSSKIVTLPCTEESGFLPRPPECHCDLIYLCSPSNPTGVAIDYTGLKEWVDYARREEAILLYDNAYLAFITSADVPKSIFAIPGAKEVAIEMRSFSKSAGFTGLRCAYAVIPKELCATHKGEKVSLNPLWKKRQGIKFNGVAYPIQRGAEATYFPEGKKEVQEQVASYAEQALLLRKGLLQMGYHCVGGTDAPYIWWQVPNGLTSWQFFGLLLEKAQIIGVPGVGFGTQGEGYLRLSAFTTKDKVEEALRRIASL